MMIGAFDLPRVRSLAEQFLGWGVRCLKVKVGLDLAGDLARVEAVRERGRARISRSRSTPIAAGT